MRKLFFLFVISVLSVAKVLAQDLVVISGEDSLNVKITKVDDKNIYFNYIQANKKENSLILPLSMVTGYAYAHFENPYNSNQSTTSIKVNTDNARYTPNMQPAEKMRHKIRFSVVGGGSFRTSRIGDSVPPDFKEYIRKLKRGYGFTADFNYYVKKAFSIGMKYSLHKAHSGPIDIYIQNLITNQFVTGKMEDFISINFIGPSVGFNVPIKNKVYFFYNASIGYMSYRNEALLISDFIIKGSTVGLSSDIGFDYFLTKKLALGITIGSVVGSLKKIEVDDGRVKQTINLDKNSYEGLQRIDVGAGLKLYLK
jgi:hypothetical protein